MQDGFFEFGDNVKNERDLQMKLALDDIDELRELEDKYGFGLLIERYRGSLEPRLPDGVFVDSVPKFDLEWLCNRIKYVEGEVNRVIAKAVLRQISSLTLDDRALRGSSYSIAVKLTVKCLMGDLVREGEMSYRLVFGLSKLKVDFYSIVDCVADLYEEKHMRYRLWTDDAVSRLATFLFRGDDGWGAFDEPPLGYKVDAGTPPTIEEFIDEVDDAIYGLPIIDDTEAAFPDYGPNGYIFSEYVPVRYMGRDHVERLYRMHLS